MPTDKPLSYKEAGVDIDAGNALVDRIKPMVRATYREGVVGDIGGFGGLFALDPDKYRQPLLVAGADGVGTKLKLAIEMQRFDTIGIDLVAMCVNDIVVQGAEPLFFLDYYATARLDVDAGVAIVSGIAAGCREAGAALLGGETAEMPGMYAEGDFDLAGFCVGIVDRDQLIDGRAIRPGNRLLGLASSGLHSNGFSLVRRILHDGKHELSAAWQEHTLGEALLEPTRIYAASVAALRDRLRVHGIAHITGGGLAENLARVLPDDVDAKIDGRAWPLPALFAWLQEQGGITDAEMRRTFNCGIGLVVVVEATAVDDAAAVLEAHGETVFRLGEIAPGTGHVRFTE